MAALLYQPPSLFDWITQFKISGSLLGTEKTKEINYDESRIKTAYSKSNLKLIKFGDRIPISAPYHLEFDYRHNQEMKKSWGKVFFCW